MLPECCDPTVVTNPSLAVRCSQCPPHSLSPIARQAAAASPPAKNRRRSGTRIHAHYHKPVAQARIDITELQKWPLLIRSHKIGITCSLLSCCNDSSLRSTGTSGSDLLFEENYLARRRFLFASSPRFNPRPAPCAPIIAV